MEQTDNPASERNNPNGFINRVFNVSLDVEDEAGSIYPQESGSGSAEVQKEAQALSSQTPIKDRQEVNRRPRAAGGIWRILNRKKAVSELERRPHSMILPGEASIPKLSFADKVRSFKKLKSPAVFRGKTGKLSTAKFTSSLVDEESFCHDIGTPQQTSRSTIRNRGKRHSYAGYTADFDCSFEDLDLSSPMDCHQPTAPGEPVTQNGCKPSERVSYSKRNNNVLTNCNKITASCEEHAVKSSPRAHLSGGRRHKDVWSYLRRISLLGKTNPVYSERSFDSELYSLDKTMDSDYGSVDFESIRDFQPPPPKPSDSKGHFGGLFKFFNSVAESARKWRTTSRSFSPPEGERTPMTSLRAPQCTGDNVHSMSLTLHNQDSSQSLPTPSSPLIAKSSLPNSFDGESPAPATGGQSPNVVLKAFRGSQVVNGLQNSDDTVKPTKDKEANPKFTATVENHVSDSSLDVRIEREQLNCLCQEEKVEDQNENKQGSKDALLDSHQAKEVNVQSQQGDKESTTNSVTASDSTEEIFKVRDLKHTTFVFYSVQSKHLLERFTQLLLNQKCHIRG